MIIISSSLVLGAAEAGINLTHPLILWDNLVTIDNIASVSEADNYPIVNLANPATNLKWRGVVNSPIEDEYLTIQVDQVDPIDSIGVVGHNWGSQAIPVSIEYLDVGQSPPSWEELVQDVLLPDDGPVLFRFEPRSISQIRIRLQPGNAVPEAAVVYCGLLLVMERGLKVDALHTPLDLGREAIIFTGASETGQFLGRIEIGESSRSQAEFTYLTPNWYREFADPFVVAAQQAPFFFAWNPSEFPYEVGYAWLTSSPMPQVDPVTGRVHLTLPMRGVT